ARAPGWAARAPRRPARTRQRASSTTRARSSTGTASSATEVDGCVLDFDARTILVEYERPKLTRVGLGMIDERSWHVTLAPALAAFLLTAGCGGEKSVEAGTARSGPCSFHISGDTVDVVVDDAYGSLSGSTLTVTCQDNSMQNGGS